MLVLDATTRSIEFLLSGAVATNQLPIVASYSDSALPSYASFADLRLSQETQKTTPTVTNNTTVVTGVAAPDAGKQRRVKYISVYNADTAAVTLTVQLNANSTTRILAKPTLAVGDTLYYVEGVGFYVLDTNGNQKVTTATLSSVTSVFGRTGAVVAASNDYAHSQVSGIGVNDHHAQVHAFIDPTNHPVSGLTTGTILRATGAGTLSFSSVTYADSLARGDILRASAADVSTPLTIGAANLALVSDGTDPAWTAIVNSLAGTAAEIAVSAATGAITLSLPAALTLTGKTVTGGTFASPTVSGTIAGSPTVSGAWTFSGAAPDIILSNSDSQILIGGSTDPGWGVAAVQLGARGAVSSAGTTRVFLSENMYYSDDSRYIASAAAVFLDLNDGAATFVTAASGTAGASLNQVAQLSIGGSGLQIGSPTGGAKGVGTINAAGDIYKNNSAYNNPHGAFEAAYTGKVEKYADRMASMGLPDYQHWTIADLEAYTRTHLHFPYFEDDANNGIFSGSERHLLITELLAIYAFDHDKRLKQLEAQLYGK